MPDESREPAEVQYRIVGEDGVQWVLSTADRPIGALPVWTELACNPCPGCPLEGGADERCPAAVAIVPVAAAAGHRRSTERVTVEVHTEARTVVKRTDLQDALRSFIGLLMSSSGCPAFRRLRPLARFHLPFASPEETLWRVAGSFAVDAVRRGAARDRWLADLREQYQRLGAMNRALCQRLRGRLPGDAGVNAVVNLYSLSICVRHELEDEGSSLALLLDTATPAATSQG